MTNTAPCRAALVLACQRAARALGVVVATTPGLARADIWIDGDVVGPGQCNGTGTEEDPYDNLYCAFESPIAPGERILLRDAAVAYDGESRPGIAMSNGTAAAPIVIEAAPGHSPRLTGTITLDDISYWTIRGLVFVGDGCPAEPTAAAINVRSTGSSITGIVIADNTFIDWPGPAIELDGAAGELIAPEVRGNRIERACGHAVRIDAVDSARVLDNDVSDVQCTVSTLATCLHCGLSDCWQCGDCLDVDQSSCQPADWQEFTVGSRIGVSVLGSSAGVEIAGNQFHDFGSDACGAPQARSVAVFATRTASNAGHIHHNFISRIAPAADASVYGAAIQLIQGASGWSVDGNIVVDAGDCGLCENDILFHGGVGNLWSHNTVVGGRVGIDAAWASGSMFSANLVVGASDHAVHFAPIEFAAPPTADHNVYWPETPTRIGSWGGGGALDLLGWQDACGCDGAAAVGDPGLLADAQNFGLTPRPGTVAIDRGAVSAAAYHGDAPDAGALEAPLALAATLLDDRPDTIELTIENRVAPPLRGFEACVGFSATFDGAAAEFVECRALDDERLELVLRTPVAPDVPGQLRYDGTAVVDSASVGGSISASLGAFTVEVEAHHGPFPGTSTGAATDGSGAATSADTTSSQTPQDDSRTSGCGCRSHSPSPLAGASLASLLLLGRRRRARGPCTTALQRGRAPAEA